MVESVSAWKAKNGKIYYDQADALHADAEYDIQTWLRDNITEKDVETSDSFTKALLKGEAVLKPALKTWVEYDYLNFPTLNPCRGEDPIARWMRLWNVEKPYIPFDIDHLVENFIDEDTYMFAYILFGIKDPDIDYDT